MPVRTTGIDKITQKMVKCNINSQGFGLTCYFGSFHRDG